MHGWLSKLWSLLGPYYNTALIYLGYPKRDHNFDNQPYDLGVHLSPYSAKVPKEKRGLALLSEYKAGNLRRFLHGSAV